MKVDIEKLPEYRRRAFVDALMSASENDDVIGIFGKGIDEPLLFAYGLKPVPIIGIDSFIFEHGDYSGCEAIKSTIIYLKTEKCPLIYSSKMFLLSNLCPSMEKALRSESDKRVEIYKGRESLKKTIEEVYGFAFDPIKYDLSKESFEKIDELIEKIRRSNLTMREVFMVEFFTRYIFSLEERIGVLEALVSEVDVSDKKRKIYKAPCPGGIYENASKFLEPDSLLIEEIGCDLTCKGCIYDAALHIQY